MFGLVLILNKCSFKNWIKVLSVSLNTSQLSVWENFVYKCSSSVNWLCLSMLMTYLRLCACESHPAPLNFLCWRMPCQQVYRILEALNVKWNVENQIVCVFSIFIFFSEFPSFFDFHTIHADVMNQQNSIFILLSYFKLVLNHLLVQIKSKCFNFIPKNKKKVFFITKIMFIQHRYCMLNVVIHLYRADQHPLLCILLNLH
mgnify:CR=1 FL=1